MPGDTRAHKLTEEAKGNVLGWLCEGLKNREVVGLLKEHHNVEVTEQAVDYYRGAYADEIDAAREEALKRAAQQGFSNRLRRLAALSRKADKLDEVLDAASVRDWEGSGKEFREFLKDIRDELGDLKTRQELTGRDGGPIKAEVEQTGDAGDPTEQSARVLGILLESGALQPGTGGAAPAEADDVDSDEAD